MPSSNIPEFNFQESTLSQPGSVTNHLNLHVTNTTERFLSLTFSVASKMTTLALHSVSGWGEFQMHISFRYMKLNKLILRFTGRLMAV